MGSSRQKTFKQQKTIQFISAVFVFILPIYPSHSSEIQFKGVRVANGETTRVMENGRASPLFMAWVEDLETFEKRHESRHIFIPGSLKYIAGRVKKNR
jgi:hypothetical protein